MIPPALTIGIAAAGFLSAMWLLLWSLCRIAKDADEILAARERRQRHADPSARDDLAPLRERRRRHARNGIGGGAA